MSLKERWFHRGGQPGHGCFRSPRPWSRWGLGQHRVTLVLKVSGSAQHLSCPTHYYYGYNIIHHHCRHRCWMLVLGFPPSSGACWMQLRSRWLISYFRRACWLSRRKLLQLWPGCLGVWNLGSISCPWKYGSWYHWELLRRRSILFVELASLGQASSLLVRLQLEMASGSRSTGQHWSLQGRMLDRSSRSRLAC